MEFFFGLLLWIGLAIAAGAIASSKSRSFFGYFILTLLLPLIGLIIAIGVSNRTPQRVAAPTPSRDEIRCGSCAEVVLKQAKVCKHCGRDPHLKAA